MKKALKLSIPLLMLAVATLTLCVMIPNIGGSYPMLDCHHGFTCSIDVRKYNEGELWLAIFSWLIALWLVATVAGES